VTDTGQAHSAPSIGLAQRARDGLIAIGGLEDTRTASAGLQTLKTACERAEAITARLRIGRAVESELSELGVPMQITSPATLVGARRQLRTVASSADATPSSLTSRLRSTATEAALKDASNAADLLEKELRRAVAQEGARQRPEGLDALASALPRSEPVSARLSKLQHDFDTQRTKPLLEVPNVVRGWRELANRWEEIRTAAQEALDRLHPEVQAFMKAAATPQGTPWSLLTAAVRDWLDTNDNSIGYRTRYMDGL
jgi:hypothetical protein